MLRDLGISIEEVEDIVRRWTAEGVAAKITGGGLGGYVLIVATHKIEDLNIVWVNISNEGLVVKITEN
jgi:mevalonate kinase